MLFINYDSKLNKMILKVKQNEIFVQHLFIIN